MRTIDAAEGALPQPMPDPGLALGALQPQASDGVKRHRVKPLTLVGVTPNTPETGLPMVRMVDPGSLLISGEYQRELGERSINLIRRIVGGWDWRRFKPPVVAEGPDGLEVIDGQHTAIAAATHPLILDIPVLVVDAADRAERAMAFLGHNRDRLGMTPMQLHYAAVARGDPEAQTIDQVCGRAGVVVLRSTPGNGVWKPCETVAVKQIGGLINRRGVIKARLVLEVLAKARCAPIGTSRIKAVETLMHDPEYANEIAAEDITSALVSLGATLETDGALFAATHNTPLWKAMAVVLFRRSRRGRRRQD